MTIRTSGIDHVHFDVADLPRFLELMQRLFGSETTPIAHLDPFGFYNACVYPDAADGARAFLDVFQPARASSPVARHLRERGPGVSFVAFRVDDLQAAAEHAARCGLREVSRSGYRGLRQVQYDTWQELGSQLELVAYDPSYEADLEDVKQRLRAGETVDGLRCGDADPPAWSGAEPERDPKDGERT